MALVRFSDRGFSNPLERMQREMNRLWSAAWNEGPFAGQVYPPMNIYDDGESFVVRAELPGVNPDDLDITVTGKTLSIKGKREVAATGDGVSFHRRERKSGLFRRAFDLPDPVDATKVVASAKHGVLEILLPRADQAKLRKVEIQKS